MSGGALLAVASQEMAERTDGVGRELDLRALARTLLEHAYEGRVDLAQDALERLFALRGRFQSYPLLRDIADGKVACSRHGVIFAPAAPALSPTMLRHFDEAIAQCQSFLQMPAPCIILQCKAETRDLHLTIESFPGLATLRLSTLSTGYPDDLRAVQFHEIAHCFLSCGVRFLDEGLAHHFASRFGGATVPDDFVSPTLPGMRVLLSRAADAMFGEGADSDAGTYRAACQVGADLIGRVHARAGADGIKAVFAAAKRACSDAEVVRAVELASGESYPQDGAHGASSAAHQALVARALGATFLAWEHSDAQRIDEVLIDFDSEDVFASPALIDSLSGALLNRALVIVNADQKLPAPDLARIDLVLKAAECLPAGRLQLWRGVRAVLGICMARPNLIKVALAGQQAIVAFNKAVALIPDDPDLLVQHASLLLNAPADYGGDRDLGVAKLRRAMTYPLYRDYARHILRNYGIDEPADAPAPLEATIGAQGRIAETEPVILAVQKLRVQISPAFLLQPGDFSLRRGERIAFVGRNGSGKTMLMESLLGLRMPSHGTVALTLSGASAGSGRRADIRQRIGGLLQGADLPAQSKVAEIMALHAVMYLRTEPAVTQALGLSELVDKRWSQLSRGQKQRVMLWLALAHLPEVAFLDEPSLGLDEWFQRALRELWTTMPLTLVIVSHVPSELLAMDRIVCLNEGRIVDSGALSQLVARHVGACKARVLQTLAPDAEQAMQALPHLLSPPRATEHGWEMHGAPGFERSFRQFIERYGVGAFSLEASSVEDFLAQVAHVRPESLASSAAGANRSTP